MLQAKLKLPSFAKVNWSLRVLGKRADGYHEIDTVLQTISLHDTLTFAPRDDDRIVLSCDDRSLPVNEQNLVHRAAKALRARLSLANGADIRLEKRIPMEAGLGGGSSNAAVTLIALSELWRLNLDAQALSELAGDLGSDVPFFLRGGTARGTGAGKLITPLADAAVEFLLVIKPGAGVSTAHAYQLLNARALTTPDAKTILSSSEPADLPDDLHTNALKNDFEAAALQLEPEIERARTALLKAGARAASLAGSGSAVFGIFENEFAQQRAIEAIELESGWRVFPCCTVGRSHYRSAMGTCGAVLERFAGP